MIEKKEYGPDFDGKIVDLYVLTNADGAVASIVTHGAALVHLYVKDRAGELADVSLGYDSMEGYLVKSAYFGAALGRFANRLENGRFVLDGNEVQLPINRPPHHLHGGERGFDKRLWTVEETIDGDSPSIRLFYFSEDGEEGYPGNMKVSVTYTLHADNSLELAYSAETDQHTIINLSNHAYFNLRGHAGGSILDHELEIAADTYVAVGETLIPTGELPRVAGTPYDFRQPKCIGADIDEAGYDQTFVINRTESAEPAYAATMRDPESGRVLKVYTTEPGIHFYSGNYLDGSIVGKEGKPYTYRSAFCLETQHYPDSPNQPSFPSVVLSPGETYTSRTIYKFEAE